MAVIFIDTAGAAQITTLADIPIIVALGASAACYSAISGHELLATFSCAIDSAHALDSASDTQATPPSGLYG